MIAYSFPLFFNKFFKKDTFLNIIKNTNIKENNSKFLLNLVYKILLNIQTYVFIDQVFLTIKNIKVDKISFYTLNRNWSEIQEYMLQNRRNLQMRSNMQKCISLNYLFQVCLAFIKVIFLKKIKHMLWKESQIQLLMDKYFSFLEKLRKVEFNKNINLYLFENNEESFLIKSDLNQDKWKEIHKKL
ncbi:Uncharacterised protein [Mesomycoplasma ovipneumoniae]|nr:Uncharacterised protein [Mesomycoplasma ovipneumoniae]